MEPQDHVMILEYWRVVWRARWAIVLLTVLATAVAFGVVQAVPKVYIAKATILPPRESAQSLSSPLGALLLGGSRGEGQGGGGLNFGGISLGGGGMTTNQDMFVAILKSRMLREQVVTELAKAWGPSVGGMLLSVQPDTRDKGLVALVVEARDPKLAAEAANTYFAQLDLALERYADQGAKRQEKAYAAQFERAAKEVEAAENALLKFQSENRVIAMDTPTKGAVEQVASLRGYIMALEMQREIMRMRFTDQHPQIRELEKQISEMKRQYSKNLFGEAMDLPPESPTARGARKEFFVAAAKMTPVQFAFLRLYRNLKIQEAFYLGALQGLQQIRYGHDSNTPRVEMLDLAIPPGVPARPNVSLSLTVAAGSAAIVGVLLAFVFEYVRRVREQDRRARRRPAGGARPDDGVATLRGPGGERVRSEEAREVPATRV